MERYAIGSYNFMDNAGESADPVLFGSLMTGVSYLPGLAGFVAVSGVLDGIYALLYERQKPQRATERKDHV